MLYNLVTHPFFQLFYLCDYEVFDLFEYIYPSTFKNMAGRLFELFGLKPRLAKLSCWGNGGRCFWDLLSHNTMQNDPWKIAHLASHQIRNASGRLWLRIMTQFEAPRLSDDRWFGLGETLAGNHVFFMLSDVFPRFFPGSFPPNPGDIYPPASHAAALPIADVLPCSCNHDMHAGFEQNRWKQQVMFVKCTKF